MVLLMHGGRLEENEPIRPNPAQDNADGAVMSFDEARSNFTVDASASIATSNYLLVGDNAYSYSFSATFLSVPIIGDLDAYAFHVDTGYSYTIVAGSASPLYIPSPSNTNFVLENSAGTILAFSQDFGSFSGLTFTALSQDYFVVAYSDGPGFYYLRLGNNSIIEANGIGEQIFPNVTYNERLDYSSDVDLYTFGAVAGHNYFLNLTTSIPDIFLDIEYSNISIDNLVAHGSGLYTFTPAVTGIYELHISSNSYHNIGNYSFVAGEVACFAAGTYISTDRGDVPVESLRVGDCVKLKLAGGSGTIRWLGHRHTRCRRHPHPQTVCPIRVHANAFGLGTPVRDLLLSPDHAIFVDGDLIPVRYLVNGATIVQEAVESITYWHVELPAHGVIFANGLPCESYLDTGNRAAFANAGSLVALNACFEAASTYSESIWSEQSCAPLVRGGWRLTAAKQSLLARAIALGHAIMHDTVLYLEIDGTRIDSRHGESGMHRFALPAGARKITICSTSGIPAELDPNLDDSRRLGVMISDVVFRHSGARHLVALDSAEFGNGFHDMERSLDRSWRWTNGAGELTVPAAVVGTLRLFLDLHIAAVQPNWGRGTAEGMLLPKATINH